MVGELDGAISDRAQQLVAALQPIGASRVTDNVRGMIWTKLLVNSTFTLAQAVDSWEVGNEPDSVTFWKPSGTNKTTGLKSYVDNFLIPAAQELKLGAERVISGGVSFSPGDMKTTDVATARTEFCGNVLDRPRRCG